MCQVGSAAEGGAIPSATHGATCSICLEALIGREGGLPPMGRISITRVCEVLWRRSRFRLTGMIGELFEGMRAARVSASDAIALPPTGSLAPLITGPPVTGPAVTALRDTIGAASPTSMDTSTGCASESGKEAATGKEPTLGRRSRPAAGGMLGRVEAEAARTRARVAEAGRETRPPVAGG